MHGRNSRSPVFPLSLKRQKIQANLLKIVELIQKYDPDFIALQEVDQISILSGSFNQFDFLDKKLGYNYKFFAPSCSATFFGKKIFISGNAIFSKYPLENCESFNFNFSFPTERKGFIIADAKLPQNKTLTISSVHLVWLDWTRLNSRKSQLNLIQQIISKRKNNFIIAGDMNCDFCGKEKSLRFFVNQLGLRVYEPENKSLNTFSSWNPQKRIDWILPSKDLSFISYKTINNRLSDHLAVFADFSFT